MPTLTNVNMIFLGTFGSVDTDETNTSAENEASLLGSYDNLVMTSVFEHDRNDDGAISDDEVQNDYEENEDQDTGTLIDINDPNETRDFLRYDVGFGEEAYQIDATMAYTARVLLGDGTTQDLTVAVLQTTIGDVFIRDVGNGLDNLNIQSIELIAVVNDNFSGSVTRNSIENTNFVCLSEGTQIATPDGTRAVEEFQPGDIVTTRDGKTARVAFVLCQSSDPDRSQEAITIARDGLAPGLPGSDLVVSPNHRILVASPIAERMFGVWEVFVQAKRLTALPHVTAAPNDRPRRFYNLLLDRHAVLTANDAPVESLYPGPQVFRALSPDDRTALRAALVALGYPEGHGYGLARLEPRGAAQRRLIARHMSNEKPLIVAEDRLDLIA